MADKSRIEKAMDKNESLEPGVKTKYLLLTFLDSCDTYNIPDPAVEFAKKFPPEVRLDLDDLSDAQVEQMDIWAQEAWDEIGASKEDAIDLFSAHLEDSGDDALVELWDKLNWALLN